MGIINCEIQGCTKVKEGFATGEQQISIIEPKTKQKVVKKLCVEHRQEWLEDVWNMAKLKGLV